MSASKGRHSDPVVPCYQQRVKNIQTKYITDIGVRQRWVVPKLYPNDQDDCPRIGAPRSVGILAHATVERLVRERVSVLMGKRSL